MTIRDALETLIDGRDLSRAEARAVMGEIMSGEATPAQIAGVLVALRAKGETADEIAGLRRRDARARRSGAAGASRRSSTSSAPAGTAPTRSTSRRPPRSSRQPPARPWPSTATARRALRAARPTCSRRSVSRSSSHPSGSRASIDELGFGFMFARAHHPAMRHAAPVRQELGVRTVFNVLGPLSNPAGACDGVFGVYSPGRAHVYAASLAGLGARRAFVVHGDGLDELSPLGPNLVVEVVDGDVREWELDPRTLGMYPADPSGAPRRLAGGERGRRPRPARGRARRAAGRGAPERRRQRSSPAAWPTISGRVSGSPPRRSTRALRASGR